MFVPKKKRDVEKELNEKKEEEAKKKEKREAEKKFQKFKELGREVCEMSLVDFFFFLII